MKQNSARTQKTELCNTAMGEGGRDKAGRDKAEEYEGRRGEAGHR